MIGQGDTLAATPSLAERREFMRLPLEERRKILARQANQILDYYDSVTGQAERDEWQGGLVEY